MVTSVNYVATNPYIINIGTSGTIGTTKTYMITMITTIYVILGLQQNITR